MKENDIVTFKLTSGDEIVAKIKKINDFQGYDVSKPHGVMMSQQGFGLVPWILTVDPDETINISADSVAAMAKTHKRVAQEYIKQTTGIIT